MSFQANSDGVVFGGEGSKLQGNFIGTDITGTLALGNNCGVITVGALIGGTVPEARNVIAGNGNFANISLGSGRHRCRSYRAGQLYRHRRDWQSSTQRVDRSRHLYFQP